MGKLTGMASMLESYFKLSHTNATALALQEMDDIMGQVFTGNTLTSYNSEKNQFAIDNYGISLLDARAIFEQYLNDTKRNTMFLIKPLFMKYIPFCCLILFKSVVLGQTTSTDEIRVNDTAFSVYLEQRIIDNFQVRLNDIGEWGTCWIKFELSPENKIYSISISNATNQIFRSFLTDVVESTNGKWTFPKEFDDKAYKVLIVPLWYNLMKDGKANRIENNDDQLLSLLSADAGRPQKIIIFPKLEYVSPFICRWSPEFDASKK
jgi:hypothetical protein